MLITNNFKIKSKNNHSGIIYTYTVDFIDGENVSETYQPPEQNTMPMPMPMPMPKAQPEAT